MGNFSNWQIVFWAAVLGSFILLLYLGFSQHRKKKRLQKTACYESLRDLLQHYTNLVSSLAQEFRFAFNHADQLTPENEEKAEAIINELERTEAVIRDKTHFLVLLNDTITAEKINAFLFQENNIRHASPRDLEKFSETAASRVQALQRLLQQQSR